VFFNEKERKRNKEHNGVHCFFIPIVEQIKDYQDKHAWNLANSDGVIRKFYDSMDTLKLLESSRLGKNKMLSCYKIHLTDDEYEQLNESNQANVFIASLSFEPKRIESLIVVNHQATLEYINPYYLVGQEIERNQVFAA
jgi:hypothetical protein